MIEGVTDYRPSGEPRQSDPATVTQNADGSFTVPAGYMGKLPEVQDTDPDAVALTDAIAAVPRPDAA